MECGYRIIGLTKEGCGKLEQKNFYNAFSVLYDRTKETLSIYQKEDFYRLIFKEIYALADDGMFDNDSIRKVTSGNCPIHLKAVKKLRSYEGFELFRAGIERKVLPAIEDKMAVLLEIMGFFNNDGKIPERIKQQIAESIGKGTDYQISRAIAALLICLNHSDYLREKGKDEFIHTDFMRLSADKPLARYPKYISDSPDSAVQELIGREDELSIISASINKKQENILISAVGGLGKTELVKTFLCNLMALEVETSGVEAIAWIPYDNHDICLSIKQALHLKCDLEEVWMEIQSLAFEYGKRLLIVVDNVEAVDNDEYLKKLSSLPCRILVTSRQRELQGFSKVLYLQPLHMDQCRELFYRHYEFEERDNEVVNDIVSLTAGLTIMIVFIAKVAYLEGLTIHELYARLVEKGFKLSEEYVSCEHEKMQNDETIIRQMCILFSLVSYSDVDKMILTYISIIPNLQFDFPKAKRWFGIKRNSSLIKLHKMGMLEHVTDKKKHIYWMHSVIAAAVREQQKEGLYDLSRPFIEILTEELNTGPAFGREYEKAYLIPFSWSVSDIMENHWCQEEDTDFLTSLFHVCFACSNYSLCEKLIDVVIKVQRDERYFSAIELAYSYRNKIDLLLQFDRAEEASVLLSEVEKLFIDRDVPSEDREILNSQYGILYQIRGDYKKSREYFERCIMLAENSESETKQKDISTAYTNMARMLLDAGDLSDAYSYIKRVIDADEKDDGDSDQIICYSTLAAICTELMGVGYGTTFYQEAIDSFEKVIRFREKNLGRHHADTAVAYHDYAYFWYICGVYDKALKYNEMAYSIEEELFAEHSITRMRSLNTKALIIWDQGNIQEADDIFEYIIEESGKMSDDYLVDVADFEFNFARCLHDQGDDDKAKEFYGKCIMIWEGMSESGNRKQAMAYQERADILFSEGKAQDALADYEKAKIYNTEDFYIMADVMDSIAACLILCHRINEGIDAFKDLLKFLVEYNATDFETKYQLCSNLFCVLDADSEEELELKRMLMEKIGDDNAVREYAENYLQDMKEK